MKGRDQQAVTKKFNGLNFHDDGLLSVTIRLPRTRKKAVTLDLNSVSTSPTGSNSSHL